MGRILIAERNRIVLEGLRSLVEDCGEEIVATVSDGRTAVATARQSRPDTAIIAVTLPGLNGIDTTRRVREALPDCVVIGLGSSTEVRFAAPMLDAGALGFVVDEWAVSELREALTVTRQGRTYLGRGVDRRLLAHPTGRARLMTEREREVLQLIAEGQSAKEIAASLGVSVKTVETHRRHLMEKLDMHSVAQLTKFALREGLTSLDE